MENVNGTSHILDELNTQDLLHGNVQILHHFMSSLKSQALRCACGLGIPAALHRLGGSATLAGLLDETGLHPSKLPYLRRLMRALTVSGIFATAKHKQQSPAATEGNSSDSETVYTLTPASRLLVGDGPSSTMSALLNPRPETGFAMFFKLEEWFRDDGGAGTLFKMAHGVTSPWDLAKVDADYNRGLNKACVADTSFVMDIILRGRGGDVFRGLTSLVDVGGGYGSAAVAIARAFPDVKCTVMDLQQVISEAPDDGVVQFVAGDMFEFVPPAQATFFKNVLDCWNHEDCVKILQQCKKAIPTRDAGGKVIIINVVVGHGPDNIAVKETQVFYDMYMMSISGIEREEHEWRKIFLEAGFSDYRITPILGYQSIIEVFP
ncbi:hypothetical protein E2562_025784 [Oryza meyeriana var. granulata]|uniref:Uncharacterized protein n=1 Tax=Oryza meyeriana var. granulata TaxID=110450 RepID=A0A6G1CSQ4_9ORYZ|nr:hypothetical protein E2562_025784 [Oryza meyeriana var. granulata]